MPNVTVMFANTKGGVGKSTLAFVTTLYLAAIERARILAADFDPQGTMYNSLSRFRDEGLRVEDWSETAAGLPMERGRLMNLVQGGKASSDVLIIDTPAGFGASDLAQFIQPDLVIVPVTPSDADIFATKAYLEEMSEVIGRLREERPDQRAPAVLVIPNQIYDADCVSEVRDALRSIRVEIGRPLPHSRDFREVFRFARGDSNVGAVVRAHSPFLRWLADRITGRLRSNALDMR